MPLRSSLATRLLAGGLAFTALLIASVSGFLLLSRTQQMQSGALSNADNRAGVAAQLIARVTEPQAAFAAAGAAALPRVQAALAGASPAAAVAQALSAARAASVPGLDVVVLNARGVPVYDAAGASHVTAGAESVQAALDLGGRPGCALAVVTASPVSQCPSVVEGTELLGGSVPAYDVAAPVLDTMDGTGRLLGVVVYSAPLSAQFQRLGPVVGFTPVFIEPGGAPRMVRFDAGGSHAAAAPGQVVTQLAAHPPSTGVATHALYSAPATGDVAGSFVAMTSPSGRVAGYLGVEVPLALFATGTAQDARTIAQLALTAMVVMSLLVLYFVDRFVRRPVTTLERGVRRIAAGDYSTDVPLTSRDELGRLAQSVNRMREQIAGYVRHVNASVARLQDVSRALTTTTGGVERLQDAVLRSAVAAAGEGATAMLLTRQGEDLVLARMHGDESDGGLSSDIVRSILAGSAARRDREGRHVLVVPMVYQGAVTGALVTVTGTAVFESDQRALEVLANNGAVALANTRLFEQERETVQQLRQLNQMKSDFLATAQHELRTPVLAIQAQLALLSRAWGTYADAEKKDLLRDIEISTRMLGELLETIVDFSLLSSDTLELRPMPVDVAAAAREALGEVAAHFKDGLPVTASIAVAPGVAVYADPPRFRKVLRAMLDNAVKFTPPGGAVSVRATAAGATGTVRIDVSDTGIGISPEALPRVFEQFYQQDNSRTRKYSGMGMGLALVQRLCVAHGASVSVRSEPGAGSTFTLTWPAATMSAHGDGRDTARGDAQAVAGMAATQRG
ncbi:MAG: HAMP domain-containing protein [Candidatus Dormibacteraeota bacterium]|nr:HAMP domain-containing protein [Candidatus Dormibacteraeota bacterium]